MEEDDGEEGAELQGEDEDIQEEVPDEGGYTTAGATSGDDDDGGDYFASGLDVDHLLQVTLGGGLGYVLNVLAGVLRYRFQPAVKACEAPESSSRSPSSAIEPCTLCGRSSAMGLDVDLLMQPP